MIIAASFDVKQPDLWLNRALYYGDGLFETMRCEAAAIPLLSWHMQRLNHGLGLLQMDPFDQTLLTDGLEKLPAEHQPRCVLKLLVFRAGGGRGYRPLTRQYDWLLVAGDLPEAASHEGLRLGVASQRLSDQPALAGLKHLNRLEQVMLASELNQQTADDLLVLNGQGELLETTQQNLLLVRDNQLYTPKLERNGVHGVALAWLAAQMQVQQVRVEWEGLQDYDEIMVANAVRGFRPVSVINGLDSIGTERRFHGKISRMWNTIFSS